MCNPAAASTFVRGATDVMTFGTAEIGGVSKRMGQSAASAVQGKGMEALTTLAVGAKTPSVATSLVDPLGPPQTTKQTPGNADAQATAAAKARRAAAMRAGIMSTIGPGLGSIGNTTPNMPAAYASGMKTALGQ